MNAEDKKSSNRLEILRRSLIKKEALLSDKFETHFATVKQANGQPLNDKRNGQSTLNKWERQSNDIRNTIIGVEKTKRAIQFEESKIAGVEHANAFVPDEILALVKTGELNQWRKHPHIFFVAGVDKARIIWDKKRNVVAHRFVGEITMQEQRSKFVKIYNALNVVLNSETS